MEDLFSEEDYVGNWMFDNFIFDDLTYEHAIDDLIVIKEDVDSDIDYDEALERICDKFRKEIVDVELDMFFRTVTLTKEDDDYVQKMSNL